MPFPYVPEFGQGLNELRMDLVFIGDGKFTFLIFGRPYFVFFPYVLVVFNLLKPVDLRLMRSTIDSLVERQV